MNVWYPAESSSGLAMRVQDYLLVRPFRMDADSRRFADLLERHVRAVFTQEMLSSDAVVLNRGLFERREQIAAQPVFAHRDATAVARTFPLVVAHPGLGGAFADNFILYEFLASHGYIVISSAFQTAAGPSMSIQWEPATSIADMDVIIRWARAHLTIGAVAVLGHSYGAQAALIYAMEGRPIDAVVSLDSTLESAELQILWFRAKEPERFWVDRASAIAVPTLLFSTPNRTGSSFFNGIVACDRRALKVLWLLHNDFEVHGVLGAQFAYDTRTAEPQRPTAEQVTASYRLVVRATHAFLEGILRHSPRMLAYLDSELPTQVSGVKLVHIPYQPAVSLADLLAEIRVHGVASAAEYCTTRRNCDAQKLLPTIGNLLLTADEKELALAVMQWLTVHHPEQFSSHLGMGEALLALRRRSEALEAYQRALDVLDTAEKKQTSSERRQILEDNFRKPLEKRIKQVQALAAEGG